MYTVRVDGPDDSHKVFGPVGQRLFPALGVRGEGDVVQVCGIFCVILRGHPFKICDDQTEFSGALFALVDVSPNLFQVRTAAYFLDGQVVVVDLLFGFPVEVQFGAVGQAVGKAVDVQFYAKVFCEADGGPDPGFVVVLARAAGPVGIQMDVGAVSYTPLTLPTKREV